MGQPAAKSGDFIEALDMHMTIIPSGSGTATVPMPYPFKGRIDGELSSDVNIMGQPAATVGSKATNLSPHVANGISFQSPPNNEGKILQGSSTVKINGQSAARNGDPAETCTDIPNAPLVVAMGTVLIGG